MDRRGGEWRAAGIGRTVRNVLAGVGLLGLPLLGADVDWTWSNAAGGDFGDVENWRVRNAKPAEPPPGIEGEEFVLAACTAGDYTIRVTQDYTRANGNALKKLFMMNKGANLTRVRLDLGGKTVETCGFLAGGTQKLEETEPATGLQMPVVQATVANGTLNCFKPDGETDALTVGIFSVGTFHGEKYPALLRVEGSGTTIKAKRLKAIGVSDPEVVHRMEIVGGAKLEAEEFEFRDGRVDLLVTGAGTEFDLGTTGVGIPAKSKWEFSDGAKFSMGEIMQSSGAELRFDNVQPEAAISRILHFNQGRTNSNRIEVVNGTVLRTGMITIQGSNSLVRISDSTCYDASYTDRFGGCNELRLHNAKYMKHPETANNPSINMGTDGHTHSSASSNNTLRISGAGSEIRAGYLRCAYGARVVFEVGEAGFRTTPLEFGEYQSANNLLTNTIEIAVDGYCRAQPCRTQALMSWTGVRTSTVNGLQYDGLHNFTNEVFIIRGGMRKRACEIEGVDPYFGKVEIVCAVPGNLRRGTLYYTAPPARGTVIMVR